jgi:hypothetical protein
MFNFRWMTGEGGAGQQSEQFGIGKGVKALEWAGFVPENSSSSED